MVSGNIAFPASNIHCVILEMHVIDQMFNKMAFTGQLLVHLSFFFWSTLFYIKSNCHEN